MWLQIDFVGRNWIEFICFWPRMLEPQHFQHSQLHKSKRLRCWTPICTNLRTSTSIKCVFILCLFSWPTIVQSEIDKHFLNFWLFCCVFDFIFGIMVLLEDQRANVWRNQVKNGLTLESFHESVSISMGLTALKINQSSVRWVIERVLSSLFYSNALNHATKSRVFSLALSLHRCEYKKYYKMRINDQCPFHLESNKWKCLLKSAASIIQLVA